MRKICFSLNPRVRFPRDFIGESGDGAVWIPSSVVCSNSESSFLTKCSIGLLLIKPSGWRPLN